MWAAISQQPLKLFGTTTTRHPPADGRRRPASVITYELKQQHTAAETKTVPEKQLTGAGVLTALQRATAVKHHQRKKKNINNTNSKRDIIGSKEKIDLSVVKPLSIKPEWNQRLAQLQARLDQLTHN